MYVDALWQYVLLLRLFCFVLLAVRCVIVDYIRFLLLLVLFYVGGFLALFVSSFFLRFCVDRGLSLF